MQSDDGTKKGGAGSSGKAANGHLNVGGANGALHGEEGEGPEQGEGEEAEAGVRDSPKLRNAPRP